MAPSRAAGAALDAALTGIRAHEVRALESGRWRHNQTMAMDAAAAFANANPSTASTPEATNDEAGCLNEDVGSSESFVMVQTSSELYAWVYTNGNEAVAPGWVFTVPTSIWFGDDYQCRTVAIQAPAWN